MYLWSQRQNMPTTPGLLWTPSKNGFEKKVLHNGVSLGQLQWIYYLQQSNLTIDKNGNRVVIDHAYHRGEKKIDQFYCDGYMCKDGEEYFFEYLGITTYDFV